VSNVAVDAFYSGGHSSVRMLTT